VGIPCCRVSAAHCWFEGSRVWLVLLRFGFVSNFVGPNGLESAKGTMVTVASSILRSTWKAATDTVAIYFEPLGWIPTIGRRLLHGVLLHPEVLVNAAGVKIDRGSLELRETESLRRHSVPMGFADKFEPDSRLYDFSSAEPIDKWGYSVLSGILASAITPGGISPSVAFILAFLSVLGVLIVIDAWGLSLSDGDRR
jgi:hypothetical protein